MQYFQQIHYLFYLNIMTSASPSMSLDYLMVNCYHASVTSSLLFSVIFVVIYILLLYNVIGELNMPEIENQSMIMLSVPDHSIMNRIIDSSHEVCAAQNCSLQVATCMELGLYSAIIIFGLLFLQKQERQALTGYYQEIQICTYGFDVCHCFCNTQNHFITV